MNCQHCGAPLGSSEEFCPACGQEVSPQTPARSRSKVWVAAISLLLVAAMVAALVLSGVIPLGASRPEDAIAARMGAHRLSNRTLSYYYWGEANNLIASYGGYGLFDADLPFSGQEYPYEGYETWHDMLLDRAVDLWASYTTLYAVAQAEGHTMSDFYADHLAAMPGYMLEDAQAMGMATADEYLRWEYGELAESQSFLEYMEVYCLVSSFVQAGYEALSVPYLDGLEMTDSVTIRHILFSTGTDDDEAVRQQAEAVYAEYLAGPGEDAFAALAMAYSADGNAQDGGIYAGVYPGQMVAEFNDWCFDPARKVGDSGIVKTQFGYHLMYFSGTGEPVPADAQAAQEAYAAVDEAYGAWLDGLLGELDYTIDTEKAYAW